MRGLYGYPPDKEQVEDFLDRTRDPKKACADRDERKLWAVDFVITMAMALLFLVQLIIAHC